MCTIADTLENVLRWVAYNPGTSEEIQSKGKEFTGSISLDMLERLLFMLESKNKIYYKKDKYYAYKEVKEKFDNE